MGTIIVGALVLAAAALAVRSLVRDRKQGKSPCGCSCSGCGGCSHCQSATSARGADE